jgi:hypothetical protein
VEFGSWKVECEGLAFKLALRRKPKVRCGEFNSSPGHHKIQITYLKQEIIFV